MWLGGAGARTGPARPKPEASGHRPSGLRRLCAVRSNRDGLAPSPGSPTSSAASSRSRRKIRFAGHYGNGAHCHHERPHQGIGNDLIAPRDAASSTTGEVPVDERLAGLLGSYRRIVA